jgi:hypothetical protein
MEKGSTLIVAPLSTNPKSSIDVWFKIRVKGKRGKLSNWLWLGCVVEYGNLIML